MTPIGDTGFEQAWLRGGATERVEASVGLDGKLGKAEPSVEAAKGGHVYVIRLAARSLTTVAGGSTDVLYVGQGDKGRVLQLWRGQHSACKRLAWAGWAQPSQPLGVVVEVQPAAEPELREVELLNAFLWEHGQMPALNSRHEGWLPSRVLKAVAGRLETKGVVKTSTAPYNGPRDRDKDVGATFTAVDLYGDPPAGKAWHWRGSLLWVWPEEWWIPDASRVAEPFRGGAFVLVACPPAGHGDDWKEIPEALKGRRGWLAAAVPSRALELHPGTKALGHPSLGGAADHAGRARLSELVGKLTETLVGEHTEALVGEPHKARGVLPADGVTG